MKDRSGGVPPTSSRLAGADVFDPTSPGSSPADLYIFEDNTSTISVLEKGSGQKLAHWTDTHRVILHWLADVVASQGVHVGHTSFFHVPPRQIEDSMQTCRSPHLTV